MRDFPGNTMVRATHFHCRGHRFDPWSGKGSGAAKKKKKPKGVHHNSVL